ncbi:hypothetical protein A8L45_05805 [Veronia pacifica]|uniref:Uncharacterized protein n=2 Tax=Veronia pacifica TaxID=1080227 RepID=A0A1C3EMX3_9GAMM|nr:hypothetical protein A8L45_05805 [Veronia pacifica]
MLSLFRKSVKKESSIASKQEAEYSEWLPNGHIFYLLSTLKLRYQSQSGLATFEQVSIDFIEDLARELHRCESTRPTVVKGVPSMFSLSVCGVCWEELEGKTRVKAIPEAALLRFEHIDADRTEARFQTVFHQCDDGTLSLAEQGNFTNSINKIHNIDYQQFLNILKQINGTVPNHLSDAIPICASNFEQPFTATDKRLLTRATSALTPINI